MFRLLTICAAAALITAADIPAAHSDAFPSKPLTWVVPFTPGGITDNGARVIAKALSAKLAQTVLVENRPGAGGVVGTEHVAKSAPDGYTFVYGTAGTIATNPALYKTTSFDTRKDLIAVHGMGESPVVVVANPTRPYKTIGELIDFAKKNPGKINFASAGAGTTTHLSAELFQQVTGVTLTHVPYKGSAPALTDLIAGVNDIMFDYPVTVMPQESAGKLKSLATLTPQRLTVMPNTPTIGEAGYKAAEIGSWSGIFVPKGTLKIVVSKLEKAFGEALKDPAVAKYYADNGQVLLTEMTKEKFDAFIDSEIPRWKKLVEMSGAKSF